MAPIPKPRKADETPLLRAALAYNTTGRLIFPCREKTTEEFDYQRQEFVTYPEKSPYPFNGLKSATASERLVREFFGHRHPVALIGLRTGRESKVWVLDLDRHGDTDGHVWLEDMERMFGKLPETARARTANNGTHFYFKHVDGVRNRAGIAPGADCRGEDGYVIAPGSVMDDGRSYEWIGHEGMGMPDVAAAPSWLLDLVINPEPMAVPTQGVRYTPETASHDAYVAAIVRAEIEQLSATQSNRNQAINQAAFSLGTLVGAGALAQVEAEGHIMAAARANGYVSKDGETAARKTMTSGMRSGIKSPRQMPEPGFANDNTRPVDIQNILRNAANKTSGQEVVETAPVPSMADNPFSPRAAEGLLGEIAAWITETSIIPTPELSMAAAICLIGGLFGGKALGPTNSGVNIFATVVLATAGGKGHAPKAIRQLADALGGGAVTNGDPTSYSALERMLRRNPSTVVAMDEFGVLLQDINGRNASSASASIRRFLLVIYDQANSSFDGRVFASAETKKDEAPIKGPALSVLGTATPETLFGGLSEGAVSDGFLNRFLFITANQPHSIRPPSLSAPMGAPAPLVDRLKEAITNFPEAGGGRLDAVQKFRVPFAGGEQGEAYRRWSQIFMWQHTRTTDSIAQHIAGRAAENTLRLATIRAISNVPSSPEVTTDDVEWGWAIVHQSVRSMLEGVRSMMSGSPAEALRLAIKQALRQTKDATLPYSQLLQRKGVSKADSRAIEDALKWLVETGEVVDLAGKAKVGSGSKLQLISQPDSQLITGTQKRAA